MIRKLFAEKKYFLPRVWSNEQLHSISHLFKGRIINVSGWTDEDKEGGTYKNDYFVNANEYFISNFKKEIRGVQGLKNEFFLDLTKSLPKEHVDKYDVVFNHTTLEHIYEFNIAFKNLCALSKDIVVLVVPFLQQMHGNHRQDYDDYWRFSPLAIRKMFEKEGMIPLQITFNNHKHSSVYIFAVASKHPERWKNISTKLKLDCKKPLLDPFENYAGCRAITNPLYRIAVRALFYLKDIVRKKRNKSKRQR